MRCTLRLYNTSQCFQQKSTLKRHHLYSLFDTVKRKHFAGRTWNLLSSLYASNTEQELLVPISLPVSLYYTCPFYTQNRFCCHCNLFHACQELISLKSHEVYQTPIKTHLFKYRPLAPPEEANVCPISLRACVGNFPPAKWIILKFSVYRWWNQNEILL